MTASPAASSAEPAAAMPSPEVLAATPSRMLTLRERFVRAASWTLMAYVASQGLRLVSSVILNRMIDKTEMGLLTMASVFLQGLQMFSDIGIGPSIIHSKRGADREYLNTAWTIQISRGFGLFLAGCAGAWPVAIWFKEPRLLLLVPICAFGSVIQGFNSTSLVSLNRNLYLGKLTAREISGQVITMVVTIAYAKFDPSIWALIVGNFAGVIFGTAVSFFMIPGHTNRLAWNKEDARGMFHFGRWIFFSTALTFFTGQIDKILFGRMLGPEALTVYGIAATFATMPPAFIKKIGAQVTFPVLAQVARDQPDRFHFQMRRVRLLLIGAASAILIALILGGPPLVRLLYPADRSDAGWMVQFLAAGAVGGVVISTYGNALLAQGKSAQISVLLVTHLCILVAASLLGNHLGGERGFVIGVSMVEWLNYPFVAVMMARHRLWQPLIDGAAAVVTGLGLLAAWMIW